MDSPLKQVWLCRCAANQVYGTTCGAQGQQASQRSRQAGDERWASLEYEHLVKPMGFPPEMLAAGVRVERTVVDLSASSAEGAWLTSVQVYARGMRGTVVDPRGRGSSRRRGRGQDTAVVTRPGRLVNLFPVCAVAVALLFMPTFALVLPT